MPEPLLEPPPPKFRLVPSGHQMLLTLRRESEEDGEDMLLTARFPLLEAPPSKFRLEPSGHEMVLTLRRENEEDGEDMLLTERFVQERGARRDRRLIFHNPPPLSPPNFQPLLEPPPSKFKLEPSGHQMLLMLRRESEEDGEDMLLTARFVQERELRGGAEEEEDEKEGEGDGGVRGLSEEERKKRRWQKQGRVEGVKMGDLVSGQWKEKLMEGMDTDERTEIEVRL
ncbi:unnamed protein product [Closterium sp. NIES-64]|nr:unnamed protein product [Closterium sp. NIES-64]CAI5999493.1 unnamed protein product [Closterium sp. NIES-64]